jgi:hypothetical protein
MRRAWDAVKRIWPWASLCLLGLTLLFIANLRSQLASQAHAVRVLQEDLQEALEASASADRPAPSRAPAEAATERPEGTDPQLTDWRPATDGGYLYRTWPGGDGSGPQLMVFYPPRSDYVYLYDPRGGLFWGRIDLRPAQGLAGSILPRTAWKGRLEEIPEMAYAPPRPLSQLTHPATGQPLPFALDLVELHRSPNPDFRMPPPLQQP